MLDRRKVLCSRRGRFPPLLRRLSLGVFWQRPSETASSERGQPGDLWLREVEPLLLSQAPPQACHGPDPRSWGPARSDVSRLVTEARFGPESMTPIQIVPECSLLGLLSWLKQRSSVRTLTSYRVLAFSPRVS